MNKNAVTIIQHNIIFTSPINTIHLFANGAMRMQDSIPIEVDIPEINICCIVVDFHY